MKRVLPVELPFAMTRQSSLFGIGMLVGVAGLWVPRTYKHYLSFCLLSYRNFLMACAALMVQPFQPTYFPLLDHPLSPGVRNLQRMIEAAWEKGDTYSRCVDFVYIYFAGYDAEGAAQLKRKLLGTSKWLGTAGLTKLTSLTFYFIKFLDLYVAFVSRGIPYVLSTSSRVIRLLTHPKVHR
jgi:hypothetical protein